jgi:hypothetical protein
MNAELTIIQKRFLNLFESQRAYLADKSTQFLTDLQHEAQDQLHNTNYSVQVAAQVNHCAATLILEERKK